MEWREPQLEESTVTHSGETLQRLQVIACGDCGHRNLSPSQNCWVPGFSLPLAAVPPREQGVHRIKGMSLSRALAVSPRVGTTSGGTRPLSSHQKNPICLFDNHEVLPAIHLPRGGQNTGFVEDGTS